MAESQITVSVGCDMEGDYCLYIQRHGRYLSEDQMDRLAPLLDEFLASAEGQAMLISAGPEDEEFEGEDPDKCECGGEDCKEIVTSADPYFATPCGTFCDECMAGHVHECGVCAAEFRDDFEDAEG